MSGPGSAAGHAFISYAREDSVHVDRLQRTLEAAGIPVWRDTRDLWPGEDWKLNIRRAIGHDALAFIACFSRASLSKPSSYQNEELLLAIDQLRLRSPDRPWLIPVRFGDCDISDRRQARMVVASRPTCASLFRNSGQAPANRPTRAPRWPDGDGEAATSPPRRRSTASLS